mmetsp:Transcript_88862/g.190772  ORF Transcript_88862/g.190772 Transcript_88862/m.190772 type:complete len:224 (+) Transcript_88862:70-741(+)
MEVPHYSISGPACSVTIGQVHHRPVVEDGVVLWIRAEHSRQVRFVHKTRPTRAGAEPALRPLGAIEQGALSRRRDTVLIVAPPASFEEEQVPILRTLAQVVACHAPIQATRMWVFCAVQLDQRGPARWHGAALATRTVAAPIALQVVASILRALPCNPLVATITRAPGALARRFATSRMVISTTTLIPLASIVAPTSLRPTTALAGTRIWSLAHRDATPSTQP